VASLCAASFLKSSYTSWSRVKLMVGKSRPDIDPRARLQARFRKDHETTRWRVNTRRVETRSCHLPQRFDEELHNRFLSKCSRFGSITAMFGEPENQFSLARAALRTRRAQNKFL